MAAEWESMRMAPRAARGRPRVGASARIFGRSAIFGLGVGAGVVGMGVGGEILVMGDFFFEEAARAREGKRREKRRARRGRRWRLRADLAIDHRPRDGLRVMDDGGENR
jgi:hypothetical protein